MNLLTDAIKELRPTCCFSISGNKITWGCLDHPVPSKDEINFKIEELRIKFKVNNCKSQAKQLLSDSDWSEIPSVIEQLENPNEWKEYRMNIRKFIINPIENPVFPDKPETIWKDQT